MTDTQTNLFDLIRREGLIVVAIAALGWQVYFLTNQSRQQDQLWRQELSEYRVMITALDKQIGERWLNLTATSSEINVRLSAISQDLDLLVKNCQTCKSEPSQWPTGKPE